MDHGLIMRMVNWAQIGAYHVDSNSNDPTTCNLYLLRGQDIPSNKSWVCATFTTTLQTRGATGGPAGFGSAAEQI